MRAQLDRAAETRVPDLRRLDGVAIRLITIPRRDLIRDGRAPLTLSSPAKNGR
jgi:hypothetical protein